MSWDYWFTSGSGEVCFVIFYQNHKKMSRLNGSERSFAADFIFRGGIGDCSMIPPVF